MTTLAMTRGDTATFTVTFSNLPSTGLTGCSFWFTAKWRATDLDAAAVFQKTGAAWTITTVGSNTVAGVATVALVPGDTSTLPAFTNLLLWDVQLKDPSGNITTVATGLLQVVADITDATS